MAASLFSRLFSTFPRNMAAPGRVVINSDNAPKPIGPYNQAIKYGGLLYLSGQIGLNPETGKLVSDDVAAQAKQALANLQAVLEAGGSSVENVLKTTVFLQDIADYGAVNEVYATVFTTEPPARSAVQVAALPAKAKVEFEAIAISPDKK